MQNYSPQSTKLLTKFSNYFLNFQLSLTIFQKFFDQILDDVKIKINFNWEDDFEFYKKRLGFF